jgi:hypothetical protein
MYTEYGVLRSNSKFPSGNAMQCTYLARLFVNNHLYVAKKFADLEKKLLVLVFFGDVEFLTSSFLTFLENLSVRFL